MQCAGPDSNRAPPDYNVATLPPEPKCPFTLGLRGIPLSQTSLAFYVVQATLAKFVLQPGKNRSST